MLKTYRVSTRKLSLYAYSGFALEGLEQRAVLSAAPAPLLPSGATLLTGPTQIADESFLNPAPSTVSGSTSPDDSDMLNFNQPAARPGLNSADLPDDVVDQSGSRGPLATPADVSATPLPYDQAIHTLRDATEDLSLPTDFSSGFASAQHASPTASLSVSFLNVKPRGFTNLLVGATPEGPVVQHTFVG